MNVHKGWDFPRGIYSEVHSPINTPEIICVMALTLQPIRGCPQHSGETGTRLSSAIRRRLLSRFFLREVGTSVHRLHESGYFWNCILFDTNWPSVLTNPDMETVQFWNRSPERFKAPSTTRMRRAKCVVSKMSGVVWTCLWNDEDARTQCTHA